MNWKQWIQLGLPLGQTLILVGVWDAAILCMSFLKDLGLIFFWPYVKEPDDRMRLNWEEISVASGLIVFKLFSTLVLLWFGTIFRGNIRFLLAWNVCMVLSILVLVMEICVFVFPSYSYHYGSYLGTVIILLLTFSYQVVIGMLAYSSLKNKDYNGMKPVGKGMKYIWDYFSNERQEAAVFCLVLEIVIDGYFLVSRDLHNGLVGMNMAGAIDEEYPAIEVEQLVIKGIRLVLNAIGLVLVLRGRREKFRVWCALSFLLVLFSTVIFVGCAVMWRGEDMFMVVAYLISFPVHLLFRCLVLFFCLRFTRMDLTSMVL